MHFGGHEFAEVWLADFEFMAKPGERPDPVCLVAEELGTGRRLRLWQDELRRLETAPYRTGPDTLFVAYYSSAELGCHLALNWPHPEHVLDLYVEFRNLTNGRQLTCGKSLLGALSYFGLDSIGAAEKDEMRQLALRGGPWTDAEKAALLDYCASDVDALRRLLPKILPLIDAPRALLRGRYMKAVARIERIGVPIDVQAMRRLQRAWPELKARLIQQVDRDFGVYQGTTFKRDRFARWLASAGIPWPLLESGELCLDEDTFKQMSRKYPRLQPLRQLRETMSKLHEFTLPIGSDGRNRSGIWAFSSRTGRNQPKSSEFIFGAPSWVRGLIRPESGRGLAYIDWSQQEIGIAAALSGDAALIGAYQSGDPYLAFAKQAGAAPSDATKATHKDIRDVYKACFLAVQYGMGAESLAQQIGQPMARARELLQSHRERYPRFWAWSDSAVDFANLYGRLHTAFGWEIHLGPDSNPRFLRNYPMQANGAEMLRLACSLATERGISVCAPVHDALLIEAPLEDLEATVWRTQEAMAKASEAVLGRLRLRSEAKLFRSPDRFEDERGRPMWLTVSELLEQLPGPGGTNPKCSSVQQDLCADAHPSTLIFSTSR
jgi:hypothetical protein